MRKLFLIVCTLVLTLGLSFGEAQAARLGGGKSLGMQRQSVAPRPTAPMRQATPAAPSAPVGTPAQPAPRRSWLGPLAGLAAGIGLGALFSHMGMGAGMGNLLTIALLAMLAVLVIKALTRRQPVAPPREPLQYAGAGKSEPQVVDLPQYATPTPASAAPQAAPNVPADFDSAAFLRVAKVNFVRLQAANDARNMDDIREFVAPEMYAEFKLAMDERGNAPQQTDVVTLEAELLEVVTEGNRHIASVRFSGMIREAAGAPAQPFAEVWNLAKPVSGERGWLVAGIQQLQ